MKKLSDLNEEKIKLMQNLISIEDEYNALSLPNIKTPEDWLYGLPIESAGELQLENRPTRLGNARKRDALKKTSVKVVSQIQKTDFEIKLAKLDMVMDEINSILANQG